MSSNDEITYYLIFDTNVLFQSYDKKSDFTSFSFNTTYDNVVDIINQLDIYNRVTLSIPQVVWGEMEKQIIEKHDELIVSYKSTITKRQFPEYSVSENKAINYSEYIRDKINEYKAELSKGFNKVVELPIATSSRFNSIVTRAFDKQPPFEGKDKKSDKGFKDALLWESILEFASAQPKSKIIYYSQDNAFGEFLLKEFSECQTESSLSICKNETEVKNQLELWAKEIDKFAYQPIENFDENKGIVEWLNSSDFQVQIIDRDFGLVEKGHLITSTSVKPISFDNIECLTDKENTSEYSVDLVLEFSYEFKDGGKTAETIDVNARIECYDDTIYSVEDVYRIDESETESEANL